MLSFVYLYCNQKTNIMTNFFEDLVTLTFTDPVIVIVRSHNSNNVFRAIAQIEDNTLKLKTLRNVTFFKLIRFRFNGENSSVFLELTKPYLKRIHCSPIDRDFFEPEFNFRSKNKEKLFKKFSSKYKKNNSFANAKKLFVFLSRESNLVLSSECGFDGEKFTITNIQEPGYLSSVLDGENRELKVRNLRATLTELRKEQAIINAQIKKTDATLHKYLI